MVKYIIILFLIPSLCFGQSNGLGFGTRYGWNNVRSITSNHLKVPNTDQSGFGMLVSTTLTDLKTLVNGGYVTSISGYDISFFSNVNCTTKLAFDLEYWNASTGQIIVWIYIATLSHTTDNVVAYMAYGNYGITTDQSNKTGVWDANFKGVWHVGDGTTLSVLDATNTNNGTNHSATATTGQVDGGAAFNGTSQYITAPSIALTTGITMEAWVYRTGGSSNVGCVAFGANGADGFGMRVSQGDNMHYFVKYGVVAISSGIASTANTWEHIVWTLDSDLKPRLYKNGSLVFTSSNTQSVISTTHLSSFGAELDGNASPGNYFPGTADEIRLSNIVRSADWVTTEYNNQSSPSTFYTISAAF